MEPSDLGFVDQILENRDLLDKLRKEYGAEIPELGVLLEIEAPWELKDKGRGLIGGRDPSWYWKVVNSLYPSLPIPVDGRIPDLPPLLPPLDDDTEYKEVEQKVIPAVGSLELEGSETFIGTGWFVGEQMVITNRHVLTKHYVAYRRDDGKIEYDRCIYFDLRNGHEDVQKRFTVTDVLYLARYDEPDVALLRVENDSSGGVLPAPLILSQKEPASGQMVLTVGYPGCDLNDICKDYRGKEEQIFPGSVFANGQLNPKKFNIKRISAGKLAEVTDLRLDHFCNTTSGSSGSAIIYPDGQVVGLHYDGDCDLLRNFAVPAAVIRQIVERIP